MSDALPKVAVKQNTAGRWIAFCREPGCTWVQSPSEKTYANQRAKAHRREHRDRIRGGEAGGASTFKDLTSDGGHGG